LPVFTGDVPLSGACVVVLCHADLRRGKDWRLKKLIADQMDKTGPVLYGTRRFVPLFTTAAIAAPPEPDYSSHLLLSHFFITSC